jgi:undecaprenyl phosphate-alpha-L-ara4FN deformylase
LVDLKVALKIDVDTHQGLGLFVTMGPDNSGRAVIRVMRNRGFLSKMFRTRAVSMYGWRTVLSGTLLPSRPIALAFPEVLRDLKRSGFEVGVHGYDHVRWQDHLDRLGDEGIRNELADAFEAFRAIVGEPARSFAAPGWRTNDSALIALDEANLLYRSDTRGRSPYRCIVEGRVMDTVEIPTTLPTLDEVMGRPEIPDSESALRFYLEQFLPDTMNVHTIHAETEGMAQLEMFTAMLRTLKERGAEFVRLAEVASSLEAAELPLCPVIRATLPGRAGWISAQGAETTTASPARLD